MSRVLGSLFFFGIATIGLLSLVMGSNFLAHQPTSSVAVARTNPGLQQDKTTQGKTELESDSDSSSEFANKKDLSTRNSGEDWPTFLGANGDSKSTEKGILTDWKDKPLKRVWMRDLKESYGIGSISRGRLIQADRIKNRCVVNCLNAETGKEIWTYSYPTEYRDTYGYNGGPRCSPVIDEDRVYMFGVEGKLTCLDFFSGKALWQVDTEKTFNVRQNFFGVGSTPVVYKDLLIVMVGGNAPSTEPNGTGVVAFEKATGKVRYKSINDLASYASLAISKIGKRDVGLAFLRSGLVGFNPIDGKIEFDFPWRAKSFESVNASQPITVGDQVFISETYGPGSALLKVKEDGIETIWKDGRREKSMQTHWNTPVHHEGFIYGSSGRHTRNAELRCIEMKTGKVKWSIPGLDRCSLLYVDGHFLSMSESGDLVLFKANPEKFEPIAVERFLEIDETTGEAQRLLKYPCWAAPILSHGLLYVRGENRLICLELIPNKK